MATGDKLVNLDELKLVYDKLHAPSVQFQITVGQWSGNGPYTYSANVTNIDANTLVEMQMDSTINNLTSDLSVTTGSGSITLSTASKPSGAINVTLFFPGVQSEVNVQVLADVYSKSQTDTLLAAKVAKTDIVNNLTTNVSTKPLSAAQGKVLKDSMLNFKVFSSIPSNNSVVYQLTSLTKCVIFTNGPTSTLQGIIITSCNSAVNRVDYNKLGATNIDISTSDNTITLSNTSYSDCTVCAIIWRGSIA